MKRDWTAARRKVDAEGKCRVCGSWFRVQAAHIVPRSLGGGQSADAIVPLCADCHTSYDSLTLELLPHLTKEEQAEAVRVLGISRAYSRLSPAANPKVAA